MILVRKLKEDAVRHRSRRSEEEGQVVPWNPNRLTKPPRPVDYRLAIQRRKVACLEEDVRELRRETEFLKAKLEGRLI